MKKILTIILSGLLLVGLVGCSGALHNKGLLSGDEWDLMYFSEGWSKNGSTKLTQVSTSEWTADIDNFEADSLGVAVKIGDSWTSRYEVKPDSGFALGVKTPTQKDEPNPRAMITGLTSGDSYKVTFVSENGEVFVTVTKK